MKRLISIAAIILATLTALVLLSATPQAVAAPLAPTEPAVERVSGVLGAINEYRASKGLTPLTLNTELNDSAQAKAEHLTLKRYWAHVAPDGTEPWQFVREAGYSYSKAGENLARCFKSGEAVVKGWVNSKTHERVMTDEYKDIGIGVAKGADGCQYVVAHFGAPR